MKIDSNTKAIKNAEEKFLKKLETLKKEYQATIKGILKKIENRRLADIKKKLGI